MQRISFNETEKNLLKELGIKVKLFYTDDEIIDMDDKVGNKLVDSGFDIDYEPNELGLLCEGILDKITP